MNLQRYTLTPGDAWYAPEGKYVLATDAAALVAEKDAEIQAITAKEGPLNTERWTLDALLTELEKWKQVASGKTCVSFENLCFGASSLWHQTHRDNFRKVDRKPEELSRWVLDNYGGVQDDFPKQVLEILTTLRARVSSLTTELSGTHADMKVLRALLASVTKESDEAKADVARLRGAIEKARTSAEDGDIKAVIFALKLTAAPVATDDGSCEDRAILDWLEKARAVNRRSVVGMQRNGVEADVEWWEVSNGEVVGTGDTLREAVRTALLPPPPAQEGGV